MRRIELVKGISPITPITDDNKRAVVKSQTAEIDGKTYLDLDIYFGGELKARYFADKKDMKKFAFADGKFLDCNINNVIRNVLGIEIMYTGFYYDDRLWRYDTEEDEETADRYLEEPLIWFESDVNEIKRNKRNENRMARATREASRVPSSPIGFRRWAEESFFDQEYLFFTREKEDHFFCTHCSGSGTAKGLKHLLKITCPLCGAPVTCQLGDREKEKKETLHLLQTVDEGTWTVRQFKAVCKWSPKGKDLKFIEELRILFPQNGNLGAWYHGVYTDCEEHTQIFDTKNPLNITTRKGYIYPDNLEEVLPFTILKNSGIDILVREGYRLNAEHFIYFNRPYWEYLIKGGYKRLAVELIDCGWDSSLVNTKATNIKDFLRLDGNRTARLRDLNGGRFILEWLRYEQKNGSRITDESLIYLEKRQIYPDNCRDILEETKSVNRFVNYFKKQRGKDILTLWRDYLRMAQGEGMDTSDDIVRFPKDLKLRHDQLVERIYQRQQAAAAQKTKEKIDDFNSQEHPEYKDLNRRILQRIPEIKRYFWEDNEYMIIPAAKCEELVTEGMQLHHCVGASKTYMTRMAEGKSWILFLREKEDLKKPYYTIEIDMTDDKILQWYSSYDRKPDQKKIEVILTKFRNSLRQQAKKSA